MASYTSNFNLKKPAASEGYSVNDQNGNMDIIDSNLEPVSGSLTPNTSYVGEDSGATYIKMGHLVYIALRDLTFTQAIASSSANNDIVLFSGLPFDVPTALILCVRFYEGSERPIRLRAVGRNIKPWWSDIPVTNPATHGWFGQTVTRKV